MDESFEERARRRRETWQVSSLEQEDAPPGTPLDNLRRLERLRRAASAMRGEAYPGRSTPEERSTWPIRRIGD